jgi:hypothetical protein
VYVGVSLAAVSRGGSEDTMVLFDSCWRLSDGTDHIEVEAYPRCVEPDQRVRSILELSVLMARFLACDAAARVVILDVYARLAGVLTPDLACFPSAATLRDKLTSAAEEGNLVVRRTGMTAAWPEPSMPVRESAIRLRTPWSHCMKVEFWQTPMGQRFYEDTLPGLVKQLERVAEALEALLAKRAKDELANR